MRIDPCEGPGDERTAWPKPICVRRSGPPVTVSPTAPLTEALRQMAYHRIHHLAVVADAGRLVGIVNEDDVPGTRRGAWPPGATVAQVMSAQDVSVGPAHSLKKTARR